MSVLRRPGGLQVLWLAVVAALAAWLAATRWDDMSALVAVSYTHLTLPTKRIV